MYSVYMSDTTHRHSSDLWRAITTGARIPAASGGNLYLISQPIEASSESTRNKPQFILRGAWVEGMGIGLLTIVAA